MFYNVLCGSQGIIIHIVANNKSVAFHINGIVTTLEPFSRFHTHAHTYKGVLVPCQWISSTLQAQSAATADHI